MKTVLPILAMVCTAGTTLVMLVFQMAGAANASAEQIHSMKFWAGGSSLLALVCVIAGIVLVRNGHHGWASLVAFLPTVIMGVILCIALLK